MFVLPANFLCSFDLFFVIFFWLRFALRTPNVLLRQKHSSNCHDDSGEMTTEWAHEPHEYTSTSRTRSRMNEPTAGSRQQAVQQRSSCAAAVSVSVVVVVAYITVVGPSLLFAAWRHAHKPPSVTISRRNNHPGSDWGGLNFPFFRD